MMAVKRNEINAILDWVLNFGVCTLLKVAERGTCFIEAFIERHLIEEIEHFRYLPSGTVLVTVSSLTICCMNSLLM